MQKILFGIFAHPDDEAFGPAATLISEVKNDTELHLITLTDGGNGQNPDNYENLGKVRLQEWHTAGNLIGATSMRHLGYSDGTLCNIDHVKIADQIVEIIKQTVRDRSDYEIEFMSLDLNGFTGHVDHIVASRSACLAFYRLLDAGLPMKRVRLFCWSKTDQASIDTGFVFMEPGRRDEEIDEIVDATQHLEQVYKVMQAHHTQRNDYEWMMKKRGDNLCKNHFIVIENTSRPDRES